MALLATTDLETRLRQTIGESQADAADEACAFAEAMVRHILGFDITDEAGGYDESDVTLCRGIGLGVAVQTFTNPQDRQNYAGAEGMSYAPSPLVVARFLSEEARRTLAGVRDRYAPGFA